MNQRGKLRVSQRPKGKEVKLIDPNVITEEDKEKYNQILKDKDCAMKIQKLIEQNMQLGEVLENRKRTPIIEELAAEEKDMEEQKEKSNNNYQKFSEEEPSQGTHRGAWQREGAANMK
uniref:Uncharacterized protein n=1 Tax=Leersia perrieri TaxID=77586 RepID=A0A0D9VFX5_9ORYZ